MLQHNFETKLVDVNVETHNLCTRKCAYCKFGEDRPWEKKWMPDETIDKILQDLAKINFSGLLAWHNNNEPLMDKRIVSIIEKSHKTLPDAKLYMFTNGELLDEDLATKLFVAGMGRIYWSIHEASHHAKAERLHEIFGEDRIHLEPEYLVDKEKNFFNRGGNLKSDNLRQDKIMGSGCDLPFGAAIVNPDGDVILCCSDFYYDVKFDNVMDKSLVDIFYNNPGLNRIRKVLSSHSRKGLLLCEHCTHYGIKVYPKFEQKPFVPPQQG